MTDKFGYYFANGLKSYSKLECMELGRTTFHFNDEVFSSIDTTKEPDEPLKKLYIERCRQIRNAYDYVVLMYSGGSDSTNILDHFIAADCKIDEICTTWDFPTTGLLQSFHNAEITNVVLPRIAHLETILDFKFRLVDLAPIIIDSIGKLGLSAEYYLNHHLSPNNVAKQFLREYIDDWKKIIESGKRLVLVWGVEKPLLNYKNGKYSLYFRDMIDNCVGPYTIAQSNHWHDELFYWTPDMPSIVIKQAHVLAHYAKLHNKPLSYEETKAIIYPTWKTDTFCNGKSRSMVYSARDEFFLKGNVLVSRYNDIVDSYYRQINDKTPIQNRVTMHPLATKEYPIC